MTSVNGLAVFNVNVGTNASPIIHLWRSDGTAAGTFEISSTRIIANTATVVDNVAYFIGYDPVSGEELWRSDGTAVGTHLVADIHPGNNGSQINYNESGSTTGFSELKAFGQYLYFVANDGSNGHEVWKSDGTNAGTLMIADTYPCAGDSRAFVLGAIDDNVLFTEKDGCSTSAGSLWKTDGSASSVTKISTVEPSWPSPAATMGDNLFFSGRSGSFGHELWKSDGTTTGTTMVKDVYPGNNGFINAQWPTTLDNTIYFGADDSVHGTELWQTDGTETGTTMVADLLAGSASNSPTPSTVFDGALFFSTNTPGAGWEQGWRLWKIGDSLPAPTNLTASSPTNTPLLSWSSSVHGYSYDIYRDGVKISSTTNQNYVDNAATTGAHDYYVVLADVVAQSAPSTITSVFVDKIAPSITTTTTKADATPYVSDAWTNQAVTVKFECQDSESGLASCSSDEVVSGQTSYSGTEIFGTAQDNAGNISSGPVTYVKIDTTVPIVGTPSWSANPITPGNDTTLNVPASDDLSGISGGEYFIGADPGAGSGMPMSYNAGNLSATFGASMPVGVYDISIRSRDVAGNWSDSATAMLVVQNLAADIAITGKNKKDLIPSLSVGDILPGLTNQNQNDKADYGFTVAIKNGALDPQNDFHFLYSANGHSFSLNAVSFAWLTIDGTNNSHGRFQGIADVTVDGVTTQRAFTVEGVDGDHLVPVGADYLQLKVFTDSSMSTLIYQATGSMSTQGGNSIRVK